MHRAQILIVDDQPDNALLLQKMLSQENYDLARVEGGAAALEHLSSHPCDVLLLDVAMPGMSGLDLTRHLKEHPEFRYVPIILVTARAELSHRVAGLDAGADDYLTKPVERRELLARVRSAVRTRTLQRDLLRVGADLEERNHALEAALRDLSTSITERTRLEEEVGDLRRKVSVGSRFGDLVGRSPGMREVIEQLRLVASSDTSVMIRGETGTGKELAARAIHQESPRSSFPFVAVNCGAIPEGLLESELFGHERGAFTGATSRRVGRLELAAGGSLFLDEIGDLPRPMQVKLLRVLQERRFERLGGTGSLTTDVRFIAATHRNLEEMVVTGDFRQDLYYRLNVFPILLPALRDRPEDIPALAESILVKLAAARGVKTPSIQTGALTALCAHRWPGNVREMENTLERAVILSRGDPLSEAMLGLPGIEAGGERARGQAHGVSTPIPSLEMPFKEWKHALLESYERRYIVEALKRHRGNRTAAAQETGVDPKTFARKIAEYHISRKDYLS